MSRLTVRDHLRNALIGPRSRPSRTALSTLGVAVGIAALMAITGVAASQQAQLLADLDDLGANLLVATPGVGPDEQAVPLSDDVPAAIERIDGVAQVGVVEGVPTGVQAYRNDLVPSGQTNGITVLAAGPELIDAVGASISDGEWFDETTRALPVAVLGATAAERLGVQAPGVRVWIGGQWYAVIGVLDSAGLAEDIDAAAFLGDEWARTRVSASDAQPIAAIYVRADPGRVDEIRDAVANTATLGNPYVDVSALSDLAAAHETTTGSLSALVLGLAGIALLVGGIGIANTMIVAVMERRGEVGLRRALGAKPGQIATQFLSEAVVLAGLGGIAGSVLGVLAVMGYAAWSGSVAVVPWQTALGGPALAIAVGALAGTYPALAASRLSPTEALRSV